MEEKREVQAKNGDQGTQERCKCNKLLCVIKGNDIEIKCNKCKRLMVIKTSGILDMDIK